MKVSSNAKSIAGLFHCAEHLSDTPSNPGISQETMERALRLAKVLEAHALAVFDMMGANEEVECAKKGLALDRARTA